VADERRGGPGSMSADELAAFLATQPSGAICVSDDDGHLLAMPAQVLDEDRGVLRVELASADLASAFGNQRQACVVADTFESYESIRGVIARGPVTRVDGATPRPTVALTMARTATFSFADDRREPRSAQAVTD
jgi:hypothetical protein